MDKGLEQTRKTGAEIPKTVAFREADSEARRLRVLKARLDALAEAINPSSQETA